jgi:hypothetical protein
MCRGDGASSETPAAPAFTTRAGATAVKCGAPALDEQQAPSSGLLLLDEGSGPRRSRRRAAGRRLGRIGGVSETRKRDSQVSSEGAVGPPVEPASGDCWFHGGGAVSTSGPARRPDPGRRPPDRAPAPGPASALGAGEVRAPRRCALADSGVASRPRLDGAADRDRRRARGPGRDRHRQPGRRRRPVPDRDRRRPADRPPRDRRRCPAAITAALALPNRRISTATTCPPAPLQRPASPHARAQPPAPDRSRAAGPRPRRAQRRRPLCRNTDTCPPRTECARASALR